LKSGGVAAITAGTGHAAATRFDAFDIQTRNWPQHQLGRFERAEYVLMAVTVHQRFPGDSGEF
jgi:hypothetical protein